MQITRRIHTIKIPFQIPIVPGRAIERFVYSYLVFGATVCLIDSGVAGSEQPIYDCLRQEGREPQDIGMMILTHAHPDHIGAAAAIKEQTGCLVLAHPQARQWVEDVDLQFRERPVPGFHSLVGGSVAVDRLLNDQETVDLGDISLKVLHTPGHSKDSLSLLCPEEGSLFAGDAIPQWNDLPIYDDVGALAESICNLKRISGINHLFASWSDPKQGDEVYGMMDDGLGYINTIHQAIRNISNQDILSDPMLLCRQMVELLRLPEAAVNPIVAQSFAAHLKLTGRQELP